MEAALELPYLSGDVAGVPGLPKSRPEDFAVEEIPSYEPCGEGDHVYFAIEKRGLGTREAVRAIARALGVAPREIGYAGLKDAQAVARQTLSLEHVDPARVEALDLEGIRVLALARHRNKLRVGHLAGNRFAIRLRATDPARDGDVRAVLDVLARRGVPNYFGEQRFGARGDSWQIGRALLKGDFAQAAAVFAGRPGPGDRGRVSRARELYDAGLYEEAAEAWPGGFRDAIRLCRAMARKKGDARRALFAVDRSLLRLFVSAYQARLFNEVLAERLERLDQVETGDLAWKHANGAVFLVAGAAEEQERAARFEISPSGPLFGRRMSRPAGRPGEIESAALARAGLALEDFGGTPSLEWQGGRRPLRFPLLQLALERGSDDAGPCLELRFALPAGCYATAVLREVLKRPARDPGE